MRTRPVPGLLAVARSTLGYELRLPSKDAAVIAAMKKLSAQCARYGYRRIRILLRRQGHPLGVHRAYRLWRLAGLQLPRKRPRRRVAAARPRPLAPANASFVWRYEFVFDSTADGRQIKCLAVVDEFTHECLAIDVAGSISSRRVIDVLTRLVSVHGAPQFLRSDNVLLQAVKGRETTASAAKARWRLGERKEHSRYAQGSSAISGEPH